MNFGFDWQYITSGAVSLPLVQQGMFKLVPEKLPNALTKQFVTSSELMGRHHDLLHRCHGDLLLQYVECEFSSLGFEDIYPTKPTYMQSLSFPMLSTSLFAANGTLYPQSAVFGDTFSLNKTALAEVGLPALTGHYTWSMMVLKSLFT